MEILQLTQHNEKQVLAKALTVLENSGLIIFPTETCYGAGVLATDQKAVDKLLKYKKRPSGKAISIAVSDIEMARGYVDINSRAENIYKKLLPGPVTVISKSKNNVANGLASEYKTLGVRIPDHNFLLELIKKLDFPITATSANSSGKKTPYSVNDILENVSPQQKGLIDLIIDAGELPKNPPSTVIDTTRNTMQVIRQGSVYFGGGTILKEVSSDKEMQELAEKLIKDKMTDVSKHGMLIMFNADLGAGKTQFVKGVAKGLGITELVKSPTYSLIEEYDTNETKLVHIDAWRLDNLSELQLLKIEDYLHAGNVVAVEWSGAAEEYLLKLAEKSKVYMISVEIDYLNQEKRKLKITMQ